jgi:hypothetical protein
MTFWQQREQFIQDIEREHAERECKARQKQEQKAARAAEQIVRQQRARGRLYLQQQERLAERASVDALAVTVLQAAARVAELELKAKDLAQTLAQQRAPQAPQVRTAQPEDTAALEARVAELEQRKGFEYCGVFDVRDRYGPGDFVTHDGSMWACRKACEGIRPGEGSEWQLAVKRGKDARR